VVWVSVIASLGYFFGSRWQWLTTELQDVEVVLGVLVVIGAIIWWWRSRRRLAHAE
jgi:membrane protein DedA with SNARE-associated domain